MYDIIFLVSVIANAAWLSVHFMALEMLEEVKGQGKFKLEVLAKGLVGALFLFWVAIEAKKTEQGAREHFGESILATGLVSGEIKQTMIIILVIISVSVMCFIGIRDYARMGGLHNEWLKRRNSKLHEGSRNSRVRAESKYKN